MANDRHAGRKAKLGKEKIEEAVRRRAAGESVSNLAKEYGISRQALYNCIKDAELPAESRIDYMADGELCSSIFVDRKRQTIRLIHYTIELSKRAFGINDSPTMNDLRDLFKEQYFKLKGIRYYDQMLMLDNGSESGDEVPGDALVFRDALFTPKFDFTKDDRVIRRTDTDGFQMKAITRDRKRFVKSQAVMAGVRLRDWAVEIIASDICMQLSIPCVKQRQCRFVYEGREFDGVYSDNFELDGYSFISFERLLERKGKSSKDDDFIKLNAVDKMKWCANELSESGDIPYEDAIKYILDLAVVDCLVGNVDRHTRNFGLFFNAHTGKYEIPLLFDNGMGLFENDYYRDNYRSFEEAMNSVYVSPYGEDPFEMLALLKENFDLGSIYKGVDNIKYNDILSTPFALEYERRILELWRK